MSVIAWDGTTLAADKRGCIGTLIRTTTKIFRIRDCLVGYSGDSAFGAEIVAWFASGAVAADFPPSLRDKDDWTVLLAIRPDKTIHKYERTPYPIAFEDTHFAIGSGRDFALTAMYLGKTAPESVEVACAFDNACGCGVDALNF